jgi:hypothetical protein
MPKLILAISNPTGRTNISASFQQMQLILTGTGRKVRRAVLTFCLENFVSF